MKIILLAHHAGIQGAGIAFAHICNGLAKNGIEVIVITPSKKGVINLIDNYPSIKSYVIPTIKNEIYPSTTTFSDKILYLPRLFQKKIYKLISLARLDQIVKNENPDIIHSNTGTIRVGSIIAKKYRIPHIWHVRECQEIGCKFKPFGGEKYVERLLHSPNNHCIAITRSVFDYYNLQSTKDTIIYDGVFSKKVVERLPPCTRKENVILYVGLISENKGVPLLLNCFEKISPLIPEFELWLVGVDHLGVQEIIKNFHSKSKIKYLGFRKDIYHLMSISKMVIVPSEYEGFGFVTVEAMLNRTLVIGRDTAGTKEQFDRARTFTKEEVGFRFLNEEELESKIMEVVSLSKEDYETKAQMAFSVVSSTYTIENNIDEIIKFYKKVLSSDV